MVDVPGPDDSAGTDGSAGAWGSGQFWRSIVDGASDIVVVTTVGSAEERPVIVYVNEAFTAVTGYPTDEILGRPPGMLQGPRTDPASRARIRAALDAREPVSETLLNYDRWGREIWLDLRIAPLRDERGEVTHFVAFERDVTDQVQTQAGLRRMVMRDGLTDLLSRKGFQDVLTETLIESRRSGGSFALVYVDLDDFKLVNDTHGHAVGDATLQVVAERLASGVRETDVAARLSGDEFALLLRSGSRSDYAAVVSRVMAHVQEPMSVAGVELQVSGSAGLATFPDDGLTAMELLDAADGAMYRVKQAGQWTRLAMLS